MSAKPFVPEDLLQVLMDIARSGARSHITSEFRRCADSSTGSNDADTFSPIPTARLSLTGPSTRPTGTSASVLHIEDTWWTAQDADEAWCRHWEEQDLDPIDPQSWK